MKRILYKLKNIFKLKGKSDDIESLISPIRKSKTIELTPYQGQKLRFAFKKLEDDGVDFEHSYSLKFTNGKYILKIYYFEDKDLNQKKKKILEM